MAKKSEVNIKRLLEDMDRYLAFCHQQNKPIKRIVLTRAQYDAFILKQGVSKYHNVDIFMQ